MEVLNRITDRSRTGDYVKCSNCERVMLVDIGEETCPECKANGTLQWVGIEQEMSIDELNMD